MVSMLLAAFFRSSALSLERAISIDGVDENGRVLVRRQLRRSQLLAFFQKRLRCLIGMEVCAGSHDWGRRLQEMGHDVRLMPPSYVKPYVKRGKTDAVDAAAICEAVTRPSMRFVAIKSEACSSVLVLHRTQIGNAIRGHMTEFGIIAAKGAQNVDRLEEQLRPVPSLLDEGGSFQPNHAYQAGHCEMMSAI